jgi:cytochrome c-type biogenesis protein CcmH/NrfF
MEEMAGLVTFFGQEGGLWAALCIFLLWMLWRERKDVVATLLVQAEALRSLTEQLRAHDAQGRAIAECVAAIAEGTKGLREMVVALPRATRRRRGDDDGTG